MRHVFSSRLYQLFFATPVYSIDEPLAFLFCIAEAIECTQFERLAIGPACCNPFFLRFMPINAADTRFICRRYNAIDNILDSLYRGARLRVDPSFLSHCIGLTPIKGLAAFLAHIAAMFIVDTADGSLNEPAAITLPEIDAVASGIQPASWPNCRQMAVAFPGIILNAMLQAAAGLYVTHGQVGSRNRPHISAVTSTKPKKAVVSSLG